jgi:protein-tyrosine-phosphatase
MSRYFQAVFFVLISFFAAGATPMNPEALNQPLQRYVRARIEEFPQISEPRRQQLQKLSEFVRNRRTLEQPARFIFICTHNSRRSQFAQVWANLAADFYRIERVESYSGGTEATAFNSRSVAALRRAGFSIPEPGEAANPHYQVRYGSQGPILDGFSKCYQDSPNPQQDFCAVMTCSHADENCPVIQGAAVRISLPFEDPKAFDGTAEESAKYDERCRQIAREMLYAFSLVDDH